MIRFLFILKKIILRFFFKSHVSLTSRVEGDLIKSLIKSKLHISNSKIKVGKDAKLINCNIKIINGELIIGDNVVLRDVEIVNNGNIIINEFVHINNYYLFLYNDAKLSVGQHCILEKGDNWRNPKILISSKSNLIINKYNRIRCDFELRFGGGCEIGEYNCINERTEIRSDEFVSIGSYNMISYGCRIWDTNTHTFYNDESRRELTRKYYPIIGIEVDKPQTTPVIIKDDNLIGEGVVILKGSNVNDKCIFGTRTVVSGTSIPASSVIIGNPCRIISKKIN